MTIDQLKSYVDTCDNDIRFELQRLVEDFEHDVIHTLNTYEDYITGRIGSLHDEVWEGVDSVLSDTSSAPVQNKVITNALNDKANLNHNHDNRYYTEPEINNLLANKVDAISGKGLSTNDYTDADKATVAQASTLIINSGVSVTGVKGSNELNYRTGNINITADNIGLGNVDNTTDLNKPISSATQAALNDKVDKVAGKTLTSNDFTNTYKTILDNLEENYSIEVDNALDATSENPVENRVVTNALNAKATINSPVFTGTPEVPNITVSSPGTQIVNKNYIDQIQNSQVDDVYFLNTTTTYNEINAIINASGILPVFITSVLVNNQQIGLNLQYTETVNGKHYFAGYIPSVQQYYVYAIDSNGVTIQWIPIASLENAALTGTPTAPTAAASTNTTQIATTAFVKTALDNYEGFSAFEVIYQTTDPADIYSKYEDGYYIYSIHNEQFYTLNYILETEESLIIQLASLNDNTIYMMDILVVDEGEGYTSETWNISTQLLVNAEAPEVYGYPVYLGYSVSTPDPTLDGQFVTKRYVDEKTQTVVAPVIYYQSTQFEVDTNSNWFTAIRSGKKVVLEITEYQLGLTEQEELEPEYIHLINSNEYGSRFSGSLFLNNNRYLTILCTLKYDNQTLKYYWDLQTQTLANISSIQAALDDKADLASPTLTGTPIAPTAVAGTNTNQIATTAFVNTATSGLIPSGIIVMWSGAIANIPNGWYLCDGTNNTPDLSDKFVLSYGTTYNTIGATGGEATHTLTVNEMPAHTHDVSINLVTIYDDGMAANHVGGTNNNNGGSETFTSDSIGGGQAHNNMPPYYVLAYIMKG